eukprot:357162-Chlamydomonas_euryale.AAC.12
MQIRLCLDGLDRCPWLSRNHCNAMRLCADCCPGLLHAHCCNGLSRTRTKLVHHLSLAARSMQTGHPGRHYGSAHLGRGLLVLLRLLPRSCRASFGAVVMPVSVPMTGVVVRTNALLAILRAVSTPLQGGSVAAFGRRADGLLPPRRTLRLRLLLRLQLRQRRALALHRRRHRKSGAGPAKVESVKLRPRCQRQRHEQAVERWQCSARELQHAGFASEALCGAGHCGAVADGCAQMVYGARAFHTAPAVSTLGRLLLGTQHSVFQDVCSLAPRTALSILGRLLLGTSHADSVARSCGAASS